MRVWEIERDESDSPVRMWWAGDMKVPDRRADRRHRVADISAVPAQKVTPHVQGTFAFEEQQK